MKGRGSTRSHHREHHVVEGGSSRAVEGRGESWIHRIVFSLVVVEGRVESWICRVVLSPLGYVFVRVGNACVGCSTSPYHGLYVVHHLPGLIP